VSICICGPTSPSVLQGLIWTFRAGCIWCAISDFWQVYTFVTNCPGYGNMGLSISKRSSWIMLFYIIVKRIMS
jgi:hypothetical protein